MKLQTFLSILIAMLCAVRSESARAKIDEAQSQAEAIDADLLLNQMKHSFRNAGGVASVFAELAKTLKQLKNKDSALDSEMSSVKTDVASLKAKQVRCMSGYTKVTATKKTISFTPPFMAKPAFISALSGFDIRNNKWLIYQVSTTGADVHLGNTVQGTNEVTWMACGH